LVTFVGIKPGVGDGLRVQYGVKGEHVGRTGTETARKRGDVGDVGAAVTLVYAPADGTPGTA